VDEDVRTKQSEAVGLRRSQSHGMLVRERMDLAFNFPAAVNGGTGEKKKRAGGRGETFEGDTPQIERNKLTRAGYSSQSQSDGEGSSRDEGKNAKPASGKGYTRRSSSGNRGKRASSLFGSGVVCEFLLFSFRIFF